VIARALVAPALLLAGMLAVLDVGGTVADIAGLLAIVAALLTFDRAVFRVVEGRSKPAQPPPDAPR
jgi:hypothetical protein